VPSFTWVATANAVLYCGATPVLCDVDRRTYNIDVASAAAKLTARTKAVIAVHLFGLCADVEALRAALPPHVKIIEDAACAAGAARGDVAAGGLGEVACFSFHPRKAITTGEGGMVVTNDAALARRADVLRNHGASISEEQRHSGPQPYLLAAFDELGFNYRMTDVQAAVGLVQLTKLDELVARRRELAQRYRQLLSDIPGIRMIEDPPYGTTNYQSFWILPPDHSPVSRDEILLSLARAGVSARRGIMAAHLEPPYHDHPREMLPVTERLTNHSLILPLFHDMTDAQQEVVVAAVRACLCGSESTSRFCATLS